VLYDCFWVKETILAEVSYSVEASLPGLSLPPTTHISLSLSLPFSLSLPLSLSPSSLSVSLSLSLSLLLSLSFYLPLSVFDKYSMTYFLLLFPSFSK
jgi:hypothetical protein